MTRRDRGRLVREDSLGENWREILDLGNDCF